MNTKYKYTVLYSLTRCLGLHSKMCATQMNTSDNPELWDIQLSSWLFCELTRQLCPWLTASSCYFFALHTMHVGIFSRLRQADFWSPNHALVTNGSAGCPCNTARVWVSQHAKIALASDHSLTGTAFKFAAFNSLTGTAVQDRSFWNHRLLLFPTRGNRGLDTHTAWQVVHRDNHHIRFQHESVLVISALYAIFWGFELTWHSQHNDY